jgi:dihydrolipoamide dehydrogenase
LSDGSEQIVDAANVLVATGTKARELPDVPVNQTSVVTSRQAMVLPKLPKRLVILGAGAIGVEFAYFFHAFGSEVTLLEMQPRILPIEDEEISATLQKSFAKSGMRVLTGVKLEKCKTTKTNVQITFRPDANVEKTEQIEADVLLVAIGVVPVLPNGIEFKLDARGFIETNTRYQTNVPGVYAAGDIIGPPWLAHVAMWEAIQAVDGIFTDKKPKKVQFYPGCTYCHPQVASVGLTEKAAKEAGRKFRVGKFPFQANGKALATGDAEGFVKILYAEPHGEIIGAHLIGPEATELIAEMTLAMNLEATHEEIEATIHAHPTLSEAIHEATGAAFNHAIHI